MIQSMTPSPLVQHSIVWFKRDLRVHDHEALWQASRQGPLRCIYIVEPDMWVLPDASRQHYEFIRESLDNLQLQLSGLGGQLEVATGRAIDVFDRLHAEAPFAAIYSHEETGHQTSYQRDIAVAAWCRHRGVAWHQFRQFGVIRGLRSRNGWQQHWERLMSAPQWPTPGISCMPPRLPGLDSLPSFDDLGLDAWDPPLRQRGGQDMGKRALKAFIAHRSRSYRGGISSPLTASHACSRLSPYLAHGCLSVRETLQSARQRMNDADDAQLKKGLHGFISRLYWHCHFIQKLESEPEIEWRNMHRGYDGLREEDWNQRHFELLVAGRTGWPMVDACVEMLRQTGWLNFRMRAMLVSVAAYPLWLHWRPVGLWLARQFLDYEPGIHWSQMQMQSGTTGINTTRIYNPVKQARDHDPEGRFVRRWLPALRNVPDSWIFEPWKMPESLKTQHRILPSLDIPTPPVDLNAALRESAAKLYARREQPEVRAGRERIIQRHASPVSSHFSNDREFKPKQRPAKIDPGQLTLDI
jgi:deoxyribodipyrimidine photo-lyase